MASKEPLFVKGIVFLLSCVDSLLRPVLTRISACFVFLENSSSIFTLTTIITPWELPHFYCANKWTFRQTKLQLIAKTQKNCPWCTKEVIDISANLLACCVLWTFWHIAQEETNTNCAWVTSYRSRVYIFSFCEIFSGPHILDLGLVEVIFKLILNNILYILQW